MNALTFAKTAANARTQLAPTPYVRINVRDTNPKRTYANMSAPKRTAANARTQLAPTPYARINARVTNPIPKHNSQEKSK